MPIREKKVVKPNDESLVFSFISLIKEVTRDTSFFDSIDSIVVVVVEVVVVVVVVVIVVFVVVVVVVFAILNFLFFKPAMNFSLNSLISEIIGGSGGRVGRRTRSLVEGIRGGRVGNWMLSFVQENKGMIRARIMGSFMMF